MRRPPLRAVALALAALLLAGAGWLAWSRYAAPTRVALVNYPGFQASRIIKSQPAWVRAEVLPLEELGQIGRYDVALLFGRALQLDAAQQALVRRAGAAGTRLYMEAPTNPDIDVTNLAGRDLDYVGAYLRNGGTTNYRRLLEYARSALDGKRLFAAQVAPPEQIGSDLLFHLDEALLFTDVAGFERWYATQPQFRADGPKIALLTSVPGPFNANRDHLDAMIGALEERGLRVYPIAAAQKRLEFLQAIDPDLVVMMPHGRLTLGQADEARDWLTARNIPMLAPVSLFQPHADWLEDQQGFAGALLTMNVVLPEIDGAVAPYAVNAQFPDADGNQVFKAIPERLERFVGMVEKWLKLRRAANADKRVAIVYYKGPGQNAMAAADLEVLPSLYATLRRLRDAGYTVTGLPESEQAFGELIQRQGPIIGPYARGDFERFLADGNPVRIPAKQFAQWCREELADEMCAAVDAKFGPPPGDYMGVRDGRDEPVTVARIEFGNVAILPQPLAGVGRDTFKVVHGTKEAPPHAYLAAYLWVRRGFAADAIVHFGTHGSLEFTPWKQVALSDRDWSDALIGNTPHFYVYTMGNVGEAIIAKRRSYTTTVTHLTPPFQESGLYSELRTLGARLNALGGLEAGAVRTQALRDVQQLAVRLKLHEDLSLPAATPWDEAQVERLANHVERLAREKISRGLYALGRGYDAEAAAATARLIAIDPLSYSLATLDEARGRLAPGARRDERLMRTRYREPADELIRKALGAGPAAALDAAVPRADQQRAAAWTDARRRPSDDEIIVGFIQMGAGGARPAAPATAAAPADAQALRELLAKVLPHPEKKAFIETLRSDREFAQASQTLDPAQMERARKIARVIPAMAKALAVAGDPDVRALLQAMQAPPARTLALQLLADPALEAKVAVARRAVQDERVRRALEPANVAVLAQSMATAADSRFVDALTLDDIGPVLEALDFYREHRELAAAIRQRDDARAASVAAQLAAPGFDAATTAFRERLLAHRAALEGREQSIARAVATVREQLAAVPRYPVDLRASTPRELDALVNALAGGFVPPSTGGDPITSPASLPTGRNMYSIDAEKTPSAAAWQTGTLLAQSLVEQHRRTHGGAWPRKVSVTLWPGDFVQTEGATLAQVLWLLGVEPVRDPFGRVVDVVAVPAARLGRPRVDVVVQTAGQFRDLAASRLYLINKAVALAAQETATAEAPNAVAESVAASERALKARGLAPAQARRLAGVRVFGGANGAYGTGIMQMVESGGRWSEDSEVARTYLSNMGATYAEGELWSQYTEGVFEAALMGTEAVIQPRESNTWGPLSLDHVYEFMGGLNLAVREVTGQDPDAYFNDFRAAGNAYVQEAGEAIAVESRATLLNPKYIADLAAGGASSAEKFAETFRNTYGWNVMKPEVIKDSLWNDLHEVYVRDRYGLGVRRFFERENPAALQEITAVMLETARKGLWQADATQLRELARLHQALVAAHGLSCTGFTCDNAPLAQFIAARIEPAARDAYEQARKAATERLAAEAPAAVVLKAEDAPARRASSDEAARFAAPSWLWWLAALAGLGGLLFAVRRRRPAAA
ncbi:MAG: cobaltochelatase subunit CobN [Steroidobacteraceae bacterium]|jgi:cobaltochelatase CobN|nr:cobaltochelatase subunit CobN [Steroidobacteraceae bacterium]